MVKLICAIVGPAGNAFPVDIDADQLVGDLKDAIRAKNPDTIKCEAAKLELFLAMTDGGAWLSSQSDDVKKLKKGEKTALIKLLIKEDQQLQAEDPLEYVLRENNMATPQSRQIHVLVVVPAGNSVDIGVTPSRLLKYKRYRRWIVHAQFISILISIIASIIVVSYGQNPTDEEGCLAADILRFVC
ncbi:hypothetical protein Plhal703r1_c13g0064631 [Plasmopara halstedii]